MHERDPNGSKPSNPPASPDATPSAPAAPEKGTRAQSLLRIRSSVRAGRDLVFVKSDDPGRPLIVDGVPRVADVHACEGWTEE